MKFHLILWDIVAAKLCDIWNYFILLWILTIKYYWFNEQADGEDELKKRQLMELAIINGTYRDPSAKLGQPGNGVGGGVVSGVGVGGGKGADLLSICKS